MKVTEEKKNEVRAMTSEQILNEWGKLKYKDGYLGCEFPDNQPFTIIKYRNSKGEECFDEHSLFHLADEYLIWLSEYMKADGTVMTEEELSNSLIGKNLGEIDKQFKDDRRDGGEILKNDVNEGRERMLTVQKLIDYLKTKNPNACIMAYEENSFAYIEQLPELPNDCICTVAEDKVRQRDFYLNQWYKDYPDKEKKCEDNIAETYRYCKDDDIVIKF